MSSTGDPHASSDAGSGQSSAQNQTRKRGLFATGELIAERYEVLRFIARGGIGEVYEVQDRQLGERLALKMLQAHEALEDVARERFRREIQLARRVTHPNVCRLYDAGTHGTGESTQPYCTMELVAGDTLHEHIEKHGAFSEEEALPILRQMAEGLEAAHAKGIVHRDFKSNNVMLEPAADPAHGPWRVVVTDFGLARPVIDDDPGMFRTDHSGGVSGTLAFMAPEQLHEQKPSPVSDLYALGVVLFHMLTADLPFGSDTPLGVMIMRMNEAPPSPRDRVPNLDRRWEAAILRLLERRPEDRFQNAREAVQAVEGDVATRLPSQVRRRWRIVGVAAVATALLASIALMLGPRDAPMASVWVADDPIQLTSGFGLEIDPAISPDGESLAYVSDQSGEFEIWQRPFGAPGQARQLTRDGAGNVQPSFSPDGGHLAYVSQELGGLFVLPVDGGSPRRLTTFGSRPAWAPDGQSLAFQSEARKDISERTLAAMPPSTLWLVDVDPATLEAAEPRQLTMPGEPTGGHGEPSFSPDGRRIAFSSGNRRRSQIWTLDIESGELEALLSEARININPLFSRDGSGLIFVGISSAGRQSASYAVWRQPLDPRTGAASGEPQKLTQLGLATIRQLTLAPSADVLVYAALSTVSSLEQIELDAEARAVGGPTLFTDRGQRNSRPAFSPDGLRVAFDRWSKGTNLDLWMRAPGSHPEERQLTVFPEWDSQAVWLADGSGLTFFSEREGQRGLWRLGFEDGLMDGAVEIEFLADIGTDADWARLSPDATRIAFHSSKESRGLDLWIRDLESGTDRRLTQDVELAGFPIWSPDGRTLGLEIGRGGSTQIAMLSLDGALESGDEFLEPIQLTFEGGESWPYSFSPDGDKIAFAGRRDGSWNLYWVSIETREVEQLTNEESLNGYVRYPAISPDGSRVLYERARTIGDLWRVDLHPAN